jgi:hypothetical protein
MSTRSSSSAPAWREASEPGEAAVAALPRMHDAHRCPTELRLLERKAKRLCGSVRAVDADDDHATGSSLSASSARVSQLRIDANRYLEMTLGAPLVDRIQRRGKLLTVTSGSPRVNYPTVRRVLDEERVKR